MEGLSPLLNSPHKSQDPRSHLVVYPSVRERQVEEMLLQCFSYRDSNISDCGSSSAAGSVLNMFHLVYNPSQVQNPIRVRQLYLE